MDTSAYPISTASLAAAYGLAIIPLAIMLYYQLGTVRRTVIAIIRMTVQLAAVSMLLFYLFEWDKWWANMGWALCMIGFAALSATNDSGLNLRFFLPPVFAALAIGTLSILFFINTIVLKLEDIFAAPYLIILGGMLLGNALKGIIIGLGAFFRSLYAEQERYEFGLAAGASRQEALRPFFQESLRAALNPTVASMATMGVVFLPGMMAGQIIGGSSPDTAIRYQLAIMLAIFACIAISLLLAIHLSLNRSFDAYGNIRPGLLRSTNG
ncbi:ABC transporter permease [Phaeodactylibacter luteus]|uniref:ABC transporter permease n=1 Tax=Phaeodactylibacter luteus TaxID=1564516 RepID=A0A5C6RHI2_9BACT|nr:ABC transporter permease [Phaeodactylibacter luteus]TXB60092.1 ABC transporter permease [Phaeodactylibacter luteus]